jgi:hypothetical protein
MKILYFTLGALIPLPVFFNLLTGEILIQEASLNNYLAGFGAPVPIGTFAVVLLGLAAVIVKRNTLRDKVSKKGLIASISLGVIFLICALVSIDLLRVVSLIFPFAVVIFVYLFSRTNALFAYSMKGYLYAVILFVVAHALSITVYEAGGTDNKILLFSSFFGYSLYQSLISYSAVMSFFGCSLIILYSSPGSPIRGIGYFILIGLIFYILGYGERKAVLLDLFVLFVSYILVESVGILFSLRIHKSGVSAITFLGVIVLYLLFFSGFAERDLSYGVAIAQRGGAYEEFWNSMSNATVVGLIFGHGGGWGGYSNIFVELIFRLGLLGVLCFLISIVLLMRFVGTELLKYFAIGSHFNRVDFHFKVWFTFFVLSLLSANSVNMDLQLPYYVINIAFISLSYLRWTKRDVLGKSLSDSPAHVV